MNTSLGNLIGCLALVVLLTASSAVSAQQWNGPNRPSNLIWRPGKVALGHDRQPTGEGIALLELNRPLASEREVLIRAGGTFQTNLMTVLEVDTFRTYLGGARTREAQVPGGGVDIAVNSGAVVGLAHFPATVPAGYRLAVGGSIRAEAAVLGDLSVGRAVSSEYALRVVGKVLAEEVRVTPLSNWPDHVFGSDYELASLDEVERFISANRRLPGMPSASEVAANGVLLGEMQVKLLLKIEELTLHVIEQQATIAALEKRLELVEREATSRASSLRE